MRVLFLTPRLPYPPNRGDRLRPFHFARALSGEHQLHLLTFAESPDDVSNIPNLEGLFATVETVSLPLSRQKLNMAVALPLGRSMWVRRFWSPEMQRMVDSRLRSGSFDMVYCYTTRMGTYAANRESHASSYRVLDFVDAVFLMVRRMAAHTRSSPKRLLLQREANLIEKNQLGMSSAFEECWIVSDADREALPKRTRQNVRVVRNGVDTDYFCGSGGPPPERPTLLFVGYMGEESTAALMQFHREVFPSIARQFPDVAVNIVGPNPPPEILGLGEDPRFRVLGFVPDLRPVYDRAHLLIAPMPFVAGVQNKVLESLAMGVPAVVTAYANQGIGAGPREGVLVVDEMSNFAGAVNRVLSEHEMWKHRAQECGRGFVERHFQWEGAAERVRQIGIHVTSFRPTPVGKVRAKTISKEGCPDVTQ